MRFLQISISKRTIIVCRNLYISVCTWNPREVEDPASHSLRFGDNNVRGGADGFC
jgi:hypothetical protein